MRARGWAVSLVVVGSVVLAAFAACGDDPEVPSPPDASTLADGSLPDAGGVESDGSTLDDGGEPFSDSGTEIPDAGPSGIGDGCVDATLFAACPHDQTWTGEDASAKPASLTACGQAGETVLDSTLSPAALQTAINNAGADASVCLKAGVYSVPAAGLQPKPNQHVRGESGTIVSGAVVVGPFAGSQAPYSASVPLAFPEPPPPPLDGGPQCESDLGLCSYDEDVFYNGQPMQRVADKASVKAGLTYFADAAAGILYIGQYAAGAKVEIARARVAFNLNAGGVVLDGILVEKFANHFDQGAIVVGPNATLTRAEVRYTHGDGVSVGGSNARVSSCNLHHNGQLGMNVAFGSNVEVSHNEIHHNATDDFWHSDGASGGLKLFKVQNDVVRFNDVHDNTGTGVWVDGHANAVLIEGNAVYDNFARGIMYEISTGGIISHNLVQRNGLLSPSRGHANCVGPSAPNNLQLYCGAGIMVTSAANVCIFENVVSGSANGIALLEDARMPDLGQIRVYQNSVDMVVGGHTGVSSNQATPNAFTPNQGNLFIQNSYTLSAAQTTDFAWKGTLAWSAWQAAGQDRCGTVKP